ncbi:hypothetical protein J6T66_02540 [bacterium]|nr:hypothetical protein [bacterium]
MSVLQFSNRLWTLDVSEVDKYERPRIIDPTGDLDKLPPHEVVRCYDLNPDQEIQIALIIWQVATKERNLCDSNTQSAMFEVAETRFMQTRENLNSLLLPFVKGNRDAARDLCINFLNEQKSNLEKYIKGWKIIARPDSVWIDENSKRMFIVDYKDRVAVGLNPTNYLFIYEEQ